MKLHRTSPLVTFASVLLVAACSAEGGGNGSAEQPAGAVVPSPPADMPSLTGDAPVNDGLTNGGTGTPAAEEDEPEHDPLLDAIEDEPEPEVALAVVGGTDPTCSRGVANGTACCPASCGTCGGSNCSSRPGGKACCKNDVLSTAPSCSGALPPCVISDAPPTSDPTCSSGIANGTACCPATCGSCGGSNCSSRPGGKACCRNDILSTAPSCSGSLPPCVIAATTPDPDPDTGSGAGPSPSTNTDTYGVQLLYPSNPSGAAFALGTADPNNTKSLSIEGGVKASKKTESGWSFWRMPSYKLNYSSGGTGKTSRLHLFASGGSQQYTWKTQKGYLAQASDVKNLEFTGYFRPRGIFDAGRAAINLKVRGGRHTKSDGDLASCVAFGVYPGTEQSYTVRFAKELHHPDYDYKVTPPAFDFALKDGVWFGMKLVSYNVPGQSGVVQHDLYIDTDPFDAATGKPKNKWRKFSSYQDVEGQKLKSSGKYSKAVTWGGYQNTVRTDGIDELDFAFVSIREITPPN